MAELLQALLQRQSPAEGRPNVNFRLGQLLGGFEHGFHMFCGDNDATIVVGENKITR
jgi:hypothetical protein